MSIATLLALLANLFFASAAISFSKYSATYGSLWVNSFKSFVALLFMGFFFVAFGYYSQPLNSVTLLYMLSGLIGLALGDYLLIIGFEKIGPARTLLIFGIQPILFLGIDYFFLGLSLSYRVPIGVVFMLVSLFFAFYENKKARFDWSYAGILCGFFGVFLDFVGVVLTKIGMNMSDSTIIEIHFWRMLGATVGLSLYHFTFRKPFLKFNTEENIYSKSFFIFACFVGTVLSLWCYLKAVEIGPLSSISAVAVTAPLFAGIFEWVFTKKPLSVKLMFSFVFFGIGFYFLS